MSEFFKLFFDFADNKKYIKRATFWNLVASLLNSFMSAIFLFFITRIIGINKAGIFTIASAFAYQCLSLGAFGVRNYHASDVNDDFNFSDYFYLRIFSGFLMMLLLIYYSFGRGYNLEKSLIIFAFGLFKSIDCFEDLLHGEFQRKGKMDIACFLQSCRYLVSVIIFILLLLLTQNCLLSCFLLTIISFFLFIILNKNTYKKNIINKMIFNRKSCVLLFFNCLPICISNAINMYIANCPKYAIDNILSSGYQTYYGILSMPVFIINLLSTIIFRPYIKKMGDVLQNGKKIEFLKMFFRQIFIILGLTFGVVLGGYLFGLSIIEFIYGVSLHKYMVPFVILLIGGGINALSSYLAVVLTAQRSQGLMFLGYFMTFIFALVFANLFIEKYSILGASCLYLFLNLITFCFFIIVMFIRLNKKR